MNMKKRGIAALLALALLLAVCLPASADGGFSQNPEEMERTAGSVLLLYIFDSQSELIATGSGFLMFDNRTLVTNYHVIEDADSVWGESDDGYDYILTRVLITDPDKDIAILRFMSPTVMRPLEPAEKEVRRGETVVAIGSPKGVKNTVSIGNVSSVYTDSESGAKLIQFTAPVSSGSSGGALLDESGKVAGITSAVYLDAQNLNVAVSVSEVLDLMAEWDGTEYPIPERDSAARKQPLPQGNSQDGNPAPKLHAASPSVVPNGSLTGKEAATDEEYYLGMLYFTESAIRDPEKAFGYFRASAEKGNPNSQFYTGYMYYTGTGTDRNYEEAFSYFQLSARQNNAGAQYYLGDMYYYGDGVGQDLDRAMNYYRMAANQGHAGAQCNLAYAYLTGNGFKQNFSEAFRYYKLSAEQGDAEAQYSLGLMYENGFYVKPDRDRAVEYYMISCEQGNEDAYAALLRLGIASPQPETDPGQNIRVLSGTYELVGLESDEDGNMDELASYLKLLGMPSTLEFRSVESVAVLVLMGEEYEFVYDPSENTLTDDYGEVAQILEKDGRIIVSGDGLTMTFALPGETEDLVLTPGVYELVSLVSSEDGDMTEDLALLREYGIVITLEIRGDGSAVLESIGETEELTYDASARIMTGDDEVMLPVRLEDGRLILGDTEDYMVFEPAE